MSYTFHWRKAIVLSVCLHIFLLIAAGYSVAGLTKTVPQDNLMELEMANDTPEQKSSSQPPSVPTNASVPDSVSTPVSTPTSLPSPPQQAAISPSSPAAPVNATPSEPSPSTAAAVQTNTAVAPAKTTPAKPSVPTAPRMLFREIAVYPADARQAGAEGTVLLRIQVLTNGRPSNVSITRSSGSASLDRAALEASRHCKFVPATDANGQPIECFVSLPYVFRLRDA